MIKSPYDGARSKTQTDRGKQYVNYVSVNPDFEERLVDELGKYNVIMKTVTESPNFAPYPRMILKYIENADDYLKEMETLNDVIAKLHARDVLVLILTLIKNPFLNETETVESQNKQELHLFKNIVAQKAKTLGIAYDRANPDKLLITAANFVTKKLNIQLVLVENVQESPLLVFCKNDSQLQEDIDNAKRKTRAGEDVMLLVVTASDNLRLVDTKATEGFGSKAKLKWDFQREKFSRKENYECIECVQNFLQRFGFDVTLPLGRKDSIKRSFINFRKSVVPVFSDEMGNDIVNSNTGKENITPQRPKPLIVFKTDKELTEKYIPCFNQVPDDSVLLMELKDSLRVVHLCSNTDKAIKMSNINIERLKVPMAEANLPSTSKTVENDKSATPLSKECSVKNEDDANKILISKTKDETHTVTVQAEIYPEQNVYTSISATRNSTRNSGLDKVLETNDKLPGQGSFELKEDASSLRRNDSQDILTQQDLNSVKDTHVINNEVPRYQMKVITQDVNPPKPPPRTKRDMKRAEDLNSVKDTHVINNEVPRDQMKVITQDVNPPKQVLNSVKDTHVINNEVSRDQMKVITQDVSPPKPPPGTKSHIKWASNAHLHITHCDVL